MVELKKLCRSLLVKFLDIVQTMGIDPERFPAKLEQIRLILLNVHNLINEARPQQTREQLMAMMRDQLAKGKEEVATLERHCHETEQLIERFKDARQLLALTPVAAAADDDDLAVWAAIRPAAIKGAPS